MLKGYYQPRVIQQLFAIRSFFVDDTNDNASSFRLIDRGWLETRPTVIMADDNLRQCLRFATEITLK